MIRLSRLLKSFNYAFKGLVKTIQEEQNLKIQILFGAVILVLAWCFRIKQWEWAVLILMISLVILMELVNSAVERITDVLKPRINGYVKEIKDIMAAAVLVASIVAVLVGVLIFWPYLSKLFGQS